METPAQDGSAGFCLVVPEVEILAPAPVPSGPLGPPPLMWEAWQTPPPSRRDGDLRETELDDTTPLKPIAFPMVDDGKEELLSEIERLKAELEQLKQAKSAEPAAADAKAQDAAAALQPRGRGRPFNIHNWSRELKADCQPVEGAIVAKEASAAERFEPVAPAAEKQQASQPQAQPLVHPWIGQFSLLDEPVWAMEEGMPLRAFLVESQSRLLQGNVEEAAAALSRAQLLHVQSMEVPLLALSASLLPLFASVRTMPSAVEHCAGLLRLSLRAARFGDTPPRACPPEMTRAEFVRELCCQAGLSLDLARLAFVHRQELRTGGASQEEGPLPICDTSSPGSAPVTPAAKRAVVGSEEIRRALKRAGRYLEAVQMDMDRLHDEAQRRAEETAAEAGGAIVPLPEWSVAPPPPGTEGEEEAASFLTPTFGQFMDEHLLPLYIADVPFKHLKSLAELYCGGPLDSDDEEKAWKTLGKHRQDGQRGRRREERGRRSRSRSRARRGGEEEGRAMSLSVLLEATSKDGTAKMRAQMLNSIVEKRRKDFRAPGDIALSNRIMKPPPATPARKAPVEPRTPVRRGTAPRTPVCHHTPATPATLRRGLDGTPMLSSALLKSPLPPATPWAVAPSPVSMRSRGRRPELGLMSPPPPTPHWNLLDSPRK